MGIICALPRSWYLPRHLDPLLWFLKRIRLCISPGKVLLTGPEDHALDTPEYSNVVPTYSGSPGPIYIHPWIGPR